MTNAEQVVRELVNMFSRVGIQSEILIHRLGGANIMSKLLNEVCRLLSVEAIRTSPYHPQTNGLVDRFNQMLKAMFRSVADNEARTDSNCESLWTPVAPLCCPTSSSPIARERCHRRPQAFTVGVAARSTSQEPTPCMC